MDDNEECVALLMESYDSMDDSMEESLLPSNSSDSSTVLDKLKRMVESAREEYTLLQTSPSHCLPVETLLDRSRGFIKEAGTEACELKIKAKSFWTTNRHHCQALPWLEIVVVTLCAAQAISTALIGQLIYNSFKSRLPIHLVQSAPIRFNEVNIIQTVTEDTCLYRKDDVFVWSPLSNTSSPDDWVTALEVETSRWNIIMFIANNLPAVFVTLSVVGYTDLVGRRFGLIVATIGLLIGNFFSIISISQDNFQVHLIIANLCVGFFGGLPTITACSYAYVADKLAGNQRIFRFSLLASLRLLGFGLSAVFVAMFISQNQYLLALWTIQAIMTFALIVLIFLVPESLQNPPIRKIHLQKLLPLVVTSMLAIQVFLRKRPQRYTRLKITLLLLIKFIQSFAVGGRMTILMIFLLGPPFCSSEAEVTYAIFISGCLAILAPFVACRSLVNWLSPSYVGVISCVTTAIGLIVQGFAVNLITLYTAMVLQIFLPLSDATASSMMASLCDPTEQGSLQAGATALFTLGSLVAYIVTLGIFYVTADVFNGLLFEIMGGIYLLCAALFMIVKYLEKTEEDAASAEVVVERIHRDEGPVQGLPDEEQGDDDVFE